MTMIHRPNTKRVSGILLHITSLPSEYGIGDLGPVAYRFADFLHRAKQRYWQVLPVNPTGHAGCPYSCLSAFAGNIMLISPELLCKDGLLSRKDLKNRPALPKDRVDFAAAADYKGRLLDIAYHNFAASERPADYAAFLEENGYWLDGFILLLKKDADKERFLQYIFFKQWADLKDHCNSKGIKLIGDIPFYMDRHSCDVLNNPELFKLNKNRKPKFVSGTPPDYFSATGQLWGHPVYNWDHIKKTGYDWWIKRIRHNLGLFDSVRIDHFIGFFHFWQVPARAKTAAGGRWVRAPAEDFFAALFKKIPKTAIIAEDLGCITDRTKAFIRKNRLTCTRVLQFGFDGELVRNPHHPDNINRNCMIYTGTHDNNTIRGWFKDEMTKEKRKNLFSCIGGRVKLAEISWKMIELAAKSPAAILIVPMQDVLSLGAESRMNIPGTADGNWQWRLTRRHLDTVPTDRLAALTRRHKR